MKKFIFCTFTVCLIFLSGCSFFQMETPMSKEDARKTAITCFEEHKEDMEAIIQSDDATGETDWCRNYSLEANDGYEFVLQQTGFTGTNTKTGVLYIPNDTPDTLYIQDENNPDIYSYEPTLIDKFYLERIEQNWFFFYDKYDF